MDNYLPLCVYITLSIVCLIGAVRCELNNNYDGRIGYTIAASLALILFYKWYSVV